MPFDYTKKLSNSVDYPTVPIDEVAARQQFMDLFDEIRDVHNTHVADNVTQLESISINVKYPPSGLIPAVGDGIEDDTTAIQALLDYVYNRGGGALLFPLGTYKTTQPLLIKSAASDGGYDFPKISLIGEGNRSSIIEKIGVAQLYSLDATCILIKGSTLIIDDAWSGIEFNNIKISNESTGALTYGVYGKSGSRLICNYSSFETIRDFATIGTHDRYAMRIDSLWACSFKDCTFHGDYGFYNLSVSTSLLMENIFVGTDKIGYHIASAYSTLINLYGDYCNGILYVFEYASVHCTALGGESSGCETMIKLFNSNITIDQAYFYQSSIDTGAVIFVSGSSLIIKQLTVVMDATNKGYLWKGGTSSNILIEKLILNGASKFKYSSISSMSVDANSVYVSPDEHLKIKGIKTLTSFTSKYWDWYVETPVLPINNIILGLKLPTTGSDNTDLQWENGGILNGFYLNSNIAEHKVLGWARESQTSNILRDGTNRYIPLILSGTTAQRPTWQIVGMQYFDTTIGKPIWCKTASPTSPVWVDATGATV